MSLETFTSSYVETALWCSTAYGAPEDTGDGSFDTSFQSYGYDESDLSPAARKTVEEDCRDFYEANSTLFDDDARAGHDFWLTRNGHGAGFWDGDYPEPQATRLTDASRAYGSCDLYIGDDGLIYTD